MESENVVSLVSPCLSNTKGKMRHKTSRNRSRSWCFTWNNYTAENLSHLSQPKFFPTEICKLIFQEEIGKEKTKHIQGFVQFKNQIDFKKIKGYLPKCHIEKCRDIRASIKYCLKQDTASGTQYTYGISDSELTKINRPRLTQDQMINHMLEQMLVEIAETEACFVCDKEYSLCCCNF